MTIGIDFGTTKTVVSWKNPKTGGVEVLKCFDGDHPDLLLSVAYLRDDGSFVFGEGAELEALRDATWIRREFKLKLGDSEALITKMIDGKKASFTATDITSKFLSYVKSCCQQMPELAGCELDAAVITVPVAFSVARRDALLKAATDAGFRSVKLELEPEAASMAYMANCPIEADRAFIVDWGGGTLDLALVEKDGRGRFVCDHEYSQGMMDVGGETLDRNFVQIMHDRFREKGANIPTPDKLLSIDDYASVATDLYLLRKSILRDKKKLDKVENCTFYPDGKCCNLIKHAVDVNRKDYRSAIRTEVEKVCELVREMVASMPRKPDVLFLAGGTCESKVIQDALEDATGLRVVKWQDSRLAVALGAAWLSEAQDNPIIGTPKELEAELEALDSAIGNEHWERANRLAGMLESSNVGQAYYLIGQYYELCPQTDLCKAFDFYRKAAELGCVDAQFRVGCICRWESGWWYATMEKVKQDPLMAFESFMKAASHSSQNNRHLARAKYELALCYLDGYGCKKNVKEAVSWFKAAAELGCEEAKNELQNVNNESESDYE